MSPVLSAVMDTLAFMRITSTSNPSSRNMPRLSASPPVRKETSTAEIDIRTLSAAFAAPVETSNARLIIAKRFIRFPWSDLTRAFTRFVVKRYGSLLRFHASLLRILASDEILPSHRHCRFFLIFRRPRAEAIAEPRLARRQLGQAQLLPNLLGVFHELFTWQRHRRIRPRQRGV